MAAATNIASARRLSGSLVSDCHRRIPPATPCSHHVITLCCVEACFQRPENQLEFVSPHSVVKFKTGDRVIKNTKEPTSGWLLNPIPNNDHGGTTCDDYNGHAYAGCPILPTMAEAAAANMTNKGCPGATYNPPAWYMYPDPVDPDGTNQLGAHTAIVDLVRVPKVTPGEYVVGFRYATNPANYIHSSLSLPLSASLSRALLLSHVRAHHARLQRRWDCETSSQVWSTCADISHNNCVSLPGRGEASVDCVCVPFENAVLYCARREVNTYMKWICRAELGGCFCSWAADV